MKSVKKSRIAVETLFIGFALYERKNLLYQRENFKSGLHYGYERMVQILGDYSFQGLLVLILVAGFLLWTEQRRDAEKERHLLLSGFFAACLLIGRSYVILGSLSLYFGDVFGILLFLGSGIGYTFLLDHLIDLFWEGYEKAAASTFCPKVFRNFYGRHTFRNTLLLLCLVWSPVVILSYPGNMTYDCLGQIEQGLGTVGYSTHHPLLHTLLVSGFVKAGKALFGSELPGLFGYILFQTVSLSAALAGTVSRLDKRGTSPLLKTVVLGIYVLSPMYSNMVSTAIKDVPFLAAVIWYILLLEELATADFQGDKRLWVRLLTAQTLVGLLRNNGIYMVVLSGLLLAVLQGRKQWKKALPLFLCLALLPLLFCKGGNLLLAKSLHAQEGSVAEMLSIPFQQTARYVKIYEAELTEEEKAVIAGVLTDAHLVGERYDSDISDPVKGLYHPTEKGALLRYFGMWFRCFFKHPGVYLDAYFAHVYGWFDPQVGNAVRYEAEAERFAAGPFWENMHKTLLLFYRLAEHVPFLAVLENVGVYVWLLGILTVFAWKKQCGRRMLVFPLLVSLLICMASPCFYLHPRYAYPILFTLPFLYGCMLQGENVSGRNDG